MKKYNVTIVFGHSFLNEVGKSVYGDGLTRKVILKGEAYTEELAVNLAKVAFGVEFKDSPLVEHTYTHRIGTDSVLVLTVK